FQVPTPCFSAPDATRPSRTRIAYMSRDPSSALRHITTNSPGPTDVSEGWQHSQIVPPGTSYSIVFFDQVAPASLENAPHSRLPLGPTRSSSQTAARCPSASPTIACTPSRAAFGRSFTATGADHVRPPSVD